VNDRANMVLCEIHRNNHGLLIFAEKSYPGYYDGKS